MRYRCTALARMQEIKLKFASACQHTSVIALLTLTGCMGGDEHSRNPTNPILAEADELEKEASKYGSIWVGAVRVADYNAADLQEERTDRRQALVNEWKLATENKLSDFKPEMVLLENGRVAIDVAVKSPIGAAAAPAVKAGADKSAAPDNRTQEDSASFNAIGANPIDLLGRKLALLNRIQLELEEDELADFSAIDSSKYHRIQLSVSLTAWTKKPARAALVYMDVYPYNGDRGCHEAGATAADYNGGSEGEDRAAAAMQKAFTRFLEDAFVSEPLPALDFKAWLKQGKAAYGLCHAALDTYQLLPRLVKVESLGDTIFAARRQQSDIDFKGTGNFSAVNVGAEAEAGADVAVDNVTATTLSFAAGSRRAGWFFMAKDKTSKTMKPVERRVRLVIDVPIRLKRLEVHVHKSFVDENELLVSGFANQIDESIRARGLLDQIETLFPSNPKCPPEQFFCSPTQWQLAKTRARNLSDHAWSERLIVDVDSAMFKPKNDSLSPQTSITTSKGGLRR